MSTNRAGQVRCAEDLTLLLGSMQRIGSCTPSRPVICGAETFGRSMLSVFVAPAGLIVSGVGLWLLSISAVSFTQGLRDLSSWRSFVLGLVLIFAGNYIYKKG